MFITAQKCMDRKKDDGIDDGEVGILGMKIPIPLTSLTSSARLRGASVEPLEVDMVHDCYTGVLYRYSNLVEWL
jgi:hypothetical protein